MGEYMVLRGIKAKTAMPARPMREKKACFLKK